MEIITHAHDFPQDVWEKAHRSLGGRTDDIFLFHLLYKRIPQKKPEYWLGIPLDPLYARAEALIVKGSVEFMKKGKMSLLDSIVQRSIPNMLCLVQTDTFSRTQSPSANTSIATQLTDNYFFEIQTLLFTYQHIKRTASSEYKRFFDIRY